MIYLTIMLLQSHVAICHIRENRGCRSATFAVFPRKTAKNPPEGGRIKEPGYLTVYSPGKGTKEVKIIWSPPASVQYILIPAPTEQGLPSLVYISVPPDMENEP